jgi:mono/diheme cytochrome c family protein
MSRDIALHGALAAVLALAGCAALRPLPISEVARGHEVARRDCSVCHAVEPGGVSPRSRAPAFGSLEMRHTSGLEGRVAQLARLGHYGMPPLKLSPAEARDVTTYIQSLGALSPSGDATARSNSSAKGR